METVVNKKKKSFSQISNSWITDDRISDTGYRLLCYIEMQSDNWIFYKEEIKKRFSWGEDKYLKAMKSIKQAGYIEHYPVKNDKGIVDHWSIDLYYELSTPPLIHGVDDPCHGNPPLYNNTNLNNTNNILSNDNNKSDDLQINSSSLEQQKEKETEQVAKFGCGFVSDFVSGFEAVCSKHGVVGECDRKQVGWFINVKTGESASTKQKFIDVLGAENSLDAIDKLYTIAGKIKWGGGYSKINSLSGIHYNRSSIVEKAKTEGITIKKKPIENNIIPNLYKINVKNNGGT